MARAWLLIFMLSGVRATCREPSKNIQREMSSCLLRADDAGRVWIERSDFHLPRREPRYCDFVGMFSFGMQPYEVRYHLSRGAAEKYNAMVRRARERGQPDLTFVAGPGVAEKFNPLTTREGEEGETGRILLALEFDGDLVGDIPSQDSEEHRTGPVTLVYEVDSIRLVNAEFVSSRWMEAWARFDELLGEIVETALEELTDSKRDALEQLMGEARRALDVLRTPEITDEWLRTVEAVGPGAAVVTTRQEKATAGRAKVLEMCVERLGITPEGWVAPDIAPTSETVATPETAVRAAKSVRPKTTPTPPTPEIPERLKPSTMPDISKERGISESMEVSERPVAAKAGTEDDSVPPLTHRPVPVESLGLTAHIADLDLLRENLVLGGIVIDSVRDKTKAGGLRPGDIVLTCTTVTHLERWTRLGAGFPRATDADAVVRTLGHMATAARLFPDLELAGLAQGRKPYPFLVLREGEVVDLRWRDEQEGGDDG